MPHRFTTAAHGEALAVRTTLSKAISLGCTHLQVESDNSEVIKFLQGADSLPPLDAAIAIANCISLCSSFASISFHFVPRDLNSEPEESQKHLGRFIESPSGSADLLEEVHQVPMPCFKPIDTPMDPHLQLGVSDDKDFVDKHLYTILVGKLIYLTTTRPDILFAIGVINQFMEKLK
ncbi:uncharacterized protein LOC122672247 [Telopea speciosissima]|uniref:uncharacterized protein LOC122672247 n=1 Tax=Telopea speciosissima TaxID=54955 RepID=UPI001CC7E741|nr:uncharacterized protein LOC122672247 [Telopea speciosissima]